MRPDDIQVKANKFAKLGVRYMLALGLIATIIITGQVLIQSHLKDQQNDSRVVNVAGKQRMLSQKIVKTILLIKSDDINQKEELKSELKNSLRLWEVSQDGLINGNDSLHLPGKNSEKVLHLFEEVNEHFVPIDQCAHLFISTFGENSSSASEKLPSLMKTLLEEEQFFLKGMEAVVFQIDSEAKEKISLLSRLEYALLFISLLVILAEIIFIFYPTALNVNITINRLLQSEKDSQKMSNEIRDLYASLEKSYEQIAHINQPIENPRTYAKSDIGGNVTFVSPIFAAFPDKTEWSKLRLCDLFATMKDPNDWMDDLIDRVSEEKIWKGEVHFRNVDMEECWAMVTVTPVFDQKGNIDELVMMGSDITLRKKAELNISRKTQAEIDKRINQQKYRSVLILEGQEEERKRIAMDIHDGIGQMLTSLKYQVESIDANQKEEVRQRLSEIDNLIKQIIREVRKVTFNLRPTVLGDYGLQAALDTFVREMTRLIDIKLEFHSETEIVRLPQKVENNIFRIIQEAINNAIKYSGANKIDVILRQADNDLIAEVKDDGKGFDVRLVDERSVNFESGRGLFNMYERSEYISGNLQVETQPNQGTTVRLTVPLRKSAQIESEV
ncbi:MAG: type IV pili methyl-accepting chemotaxis transducer N-terminal domain-containing protein [Bacteroidetes bacterium]|nr:type IV pili methyl-accepting chemotaxis transducer N-terminal domain-containing protein [Bacteroidota bacterium]